MASDRNGLENRSRSECLSLLESATIGRMGSRGTKLDAAFMGLVVGFEVEGFDAAWHNWSVLVPGVAEEATDPGDIQRLPPARLDPWTGVDRHVVRIANLNLSGRRLEASGSGNVSR